MSFSGPLWLIGLLPWAALALYLLWGRRRKEPVPFLDLWLGPVRGPQARTKLAAPPLALALGLLAMLLALLAAARPRLDLNARLRGPRITILLDTGATLSARGRTSTRLVETAQALTDELVKHGALTPLEVHTVPPRPVVRTDVSDWMTTVRGLARTALDTTDAVNATAAALLGGDGAIVVVSDRPLTPALEGVIQVIPDSRVANLGIVAATVRDSPAPQAMVRLRNDSDVSSARLEVTTAGRTTATQIPLPPAGAAAGDVFIDLPEAGDVIKFRLVAEDAMEADNVAWLVREGSRPRIEPRVALSPELARMVEVYARSRPANESSPRVAVVDDLGAIQTGMAAVVVAPAGAEAPSSDIQMTAHPLTRNLDAGFRFPSVRLSDKAPEGWTAVVRIGPGVAVAVREQPARQVWVGFDSPDWPRRPEFVVFWANVFDWLGGAAPQWRADPVAPLGTGWKKVDGDDVGAEPGLWPGLYERAQDGTRRAVNAAYVAIPPPPASPDWRPKLAAALTRPHHGQPLAPALLLTALACLALSALLWTGRRRRWWPGS